MTLEFPTRRNVLKLGLGGLALPALPALSRSAAAQDTITFATITPHTGPFAFAGKLLINGANLAIEGRGGRILGKQIRHVVRDSEGKAAVAVRRLTEAIQSDDVKVFHCNYSSAVGLAQSEIAAKYKVLQYAAGGSEDFTGSRCSRYTFQWAANAYTALKATMDYVEAELPKAKRWYTITADYVFGHSLLKYAKVVGKEKGIEIVGNDFHPFGERQFTQYITKAIATKPDVLCLLNGGSDTVINLRQFYQYGARGIRVVAPWSIEVDQMPELAPEMRDGLILGQNYYHTIDTPANREFAGKYIAKFNSPPNYASAYGYDTFRIPLMAMEKAGTTEIAKVIQTMEGMEFESLVGPARIDPKTHQTIRPYFVVRGKAQSAMKDATDFADVVHVGSDPQPPDLNECKGLGPI